MNKIGLIIAREYATRVKKKSFIIMTILGPLLMALFYGGMIYVMLSGQEKPHTVMVVDNSFSRVSEGLKEYNQRNPKSNLKFEWKYNDYVEAKTKMFEEDYHSVLYIPVDPVSNPNQMFVASKERMPSSMLKATEIALEKEIEFVKMKEKNISQADFDDIRTKIVLFDKKIKAPTGPDGAMEEEKMKDNTLNKGISFLANILIYMFVLLYGVQVMRGVMEEKTNRIVEVMISSVKPFQLMIGKIVGIAFVALTQFVIWIVLSGVVIFAIGLFIAPTAMEQIEAGTMATQAQVAGIDFGSMFDFTLRDLLVMCSMFVFYFITGYLFYASLFAAVGSAVDVDSDSQQFVMPITLPLIIGFMVANTVMENPDGKLAFWFSMIPFTSPMVMMARIPFGVPIWEVAVSMILMILAFVGSTWMAAKIYKTGILMYGKKITFKEIGKWLFYKN